MNLKFIKQNHKEFTNGFIFYFFYYFLGQSINCTQCNKNPQLRAQKQTLIFFYNSLWDFFFNNLLCYFQKNTNSLLLLSFIKKNCFFKKEQ